MCKTPVEEVCISHSVCFLSLRSRLDFVFRRNNSSQERVWPVVFVGVLMSGFSDLVRKWLSLRSKNINVSIRHCSSYFDDANISDLSQWRVTHFISRITFRCSSRSFSLVFFNARSISCQPNRGDWATDRNLLSKRVSRTASTVWTTECWRVRLSSRFDRKTTSFPFQCLDSEKPGAWYGIDDLWNTHLCLCASFATLNLSIACLRATLPFDDAPNDRHWITYFRHV